MSRIVKAGLIQATHACSTDESIETIRNANIEKHLGLIEQAAREGVQIICMQEIFTGPYFCAEQTTRWYESTERIPDGPTVKLMQEEVHVNPLHLKVIPWASRKGVTVLHRPNNILSPIWVTVK